MSRDMSRKIRNSYDPPTAIEIERNGRRFTGTFRVDPDMIHRSKTASLGGHRHHPETLARIVLGNIVTEAGF